MTGSRRNTYRPATLTYQLEKGLPSPGSPFFMRNPWIPGHGAGTFRHKNDLVQNNKMICALLF